MTLLKTIRVLIFSIIINHLYFNYITFVLLFTIMYIIIIMYYVLVVFIFFEFEETC